MNRVQIAGLSCMPRELSVAIFPQRFDVVEQGGCAVAITELNAVPYLPRALDVVARVERCQAACGVVCSQSLVEVTQNLNACGELRGFARIERLARTQLFALIAIKHSQRNTDSDTTKVVRTIALVFASKCEVRCAICLREPDLRFRSANRTNRCQIIRTRRQSRSFELLAIKLEFRRRQISSDVE